MALFMSLPRTALALVLLLLGGTAGPARAAIPTIQESAMKFTSGGKEIQLHKYTLASDAKEALKRPVVIILHGSDGLARKDNGYQLTARGVAAEGYVAVLVSYFDRTDTKGIADEKTIRQNFAAWMETIGDAMNVVQKMPDTDPKRIGLLGFSLGGYLSMSLATQHPGVAAVAEYFGGLPDVFAQKVTKMPPTLILHGAQDKIVPVAEAKKIEKLYEQKHLTYESKIYRDQGHGFTGAAAIDAAFRTARFFGKYLADQDAE